MHTVQLTASAIALMTLSGAALAERPDYFNDRARVLSSTPVYQQVSQPRQQCSVETVGGGYREAPRNYGGALIGGVVGGLLGNTVGGGNGRTAATAVGAVAGALVRWWATISADEIVAATMSSRARLSSAAP